MLKIKDNVDLKELEKRKFYLEGNTYKRNVGICCIFETDRDNVFKTSGRYSRAKDGVNHIRESFIAKEYCTTSYSKENFRLVEFAIPNWFNLEWNWRKLD